MRSLRRIWEAYVTESAMKIYTKSYLLAIVTVGMKEHGLKLFRNSNLEWLKRATKQKSEWYERQGE